MTKTLKILPSRSGLRPWRLTLEQAWCPDLDIALMSDGIAREVYGLTVSSWDMPGAPTPAADLREAARQAVIVQLEAAMLDAWNDICADTGCHPLDIDQAGKGRLEFTPGHWARATATAIAAQLEQLIARCQGRDELALARCRVAVGLPGDLGGSLAESAD